MALILTDAQQSTVSVAFSDSEGNTAQTEGTPVWASDNPGVVSVVPAADGLSAVVSSVEGGGLGEAIVTVTADADLGEGVVEVTGSLPVSVISGEATGVVLTPGPVEDRPQ